MITGKQQEAIDKLKALLVRRYGEATQENVQKLFADYADPEGLIGSRELSHLLEDANIGNALTRPAWVAGMFSALGTGGSKVSWEQVVDKMQKANLKLT